MTWMQPQLTDPPMGPTDEIRKLQHRMIFAYARNSKAIELNVHESGVFDAATDAALRNLQPHLTPPQPANGILTYDTKIATGVIVLPPKAPTKRFVQQGVGFDTSAFLMGNVQHSYIDAMNECLAEFLRIALPLVGVPKVLYGYSMGADGVNHCLLNWPVERRNEIKLVGQFGNPARPPGPTLLGNNPEGSGIAGVFTPDWARPITYDFTHDGDMYPNAVGLLPFLYQILTRMELSLEFALYLFNVLTSTMGPMLLGMAGSMIPGFSTLTTGFGALSGILGMVTAGPVTQTTGPVVQPFALFAMLPMIIPTIAAALKFVSTNAHFHYHDQPEPFWRGLTAVDCLAQITAERVHDAIVYTVPGTVSFWNDGPPAWTAWKLP